MALEITVIPLWAWFCVFFGSVLLTLGAIASPKNSWILALAGFLSLLSALTGSLVGESVLIGDVLTPAYYTILNQGLTYIAVFKLFIDIFLLLILEYGEISSLLKRG